MAESLQRIKDLLSPFVYLMCLLSLDIVHLRENYNIQIYDIKHMNSK